jgi:hypothetical protein
MRTTVEIADAHRARLHGVLLTRNIGHFERVPGLKISGRHLEKGGRTWTG